MADQTCTSDEIRIKNLLEQWDLYVIESSRRKNNRKRGIDVRGKLIPYELLANIRRIFIHLNYENVATVYNRFLTLLCHNTIVSVIKGMSEGSECDITEPFRGGKDDRLSNAHNFGVNGLSSIFLYAGGLNIIDRKDGLGFTPMPEHFPVIEALRSLVDVSKFNETSTEDHIKISFEDIDTWLQGNDITTRVKSASKQ